jgi:hypothetical protein
VTLPFGPENMPQFPQFPQQMQQQGQIGGMGGGGILQQLLSKLPPELMASIQGLQQQAGDMRGQAQQVRQQIPQQMQQMQFQLPQLLQLAQQLRGGSIGGGPGF